MERTYLYTIMQEIQNKGLKLKIELEDLDKYLEWVNETSYRLMVVYKSESLELTYKPNRGIEFRILLKGNTTKITDKFMYEVNVINDALNAGKTRNDHITILSDEDIYKLTNKI